MATRASEELHEARLNHLHTASRLAFRICPQLAAFYGNEFLTALGGQRATNTIARHQCTYCGSPLVDGRSISRVSVVRSTKRQPQRTSHGICKGTWGRQQTQPVANKPGTVVDTSRRRVIKIRLNDASSATGHSKPTKEESARARQDQKNTIHYICELCDSRLVFPGSTKSGLQAAGLAGGSDANSGLKNKSKGAALEPPKYLGPTKPERAIQSSTKQKVRSKPPANAETPPTAATAAPATTATTATTKTTKTTKTAVAMNAAVAPSIISSNAKQDDAQSKKRKRHKSNLLATVAANKKKVEQKKNEGASFSLSDFLSSL
ncbi:hypothetical protein GGI26_001643 [Coemansia sp. RSA 1358]|uniref:Rpr2-domain-containing protein n=1 Tax=Coemansia umbellata TaxID=1424467 RepID=A0ABQ8PRB0_9FUNG|nr:hypothetical protein EDC05_001604 [Coemansia umbellata]KAJ2624287.1 hypothetical protein GGI26_001643 [Coemansia sp. RSA 1358]